MAAQTTSHTSRRRDIRSRARSTVHAIATSAAATASQPNRSQSRANASHGRSPCRIRANPPTTAGTAAQAANTDPTRLVSGRSTSSAAASPSATQPTLTVAAAGSRSWLRPAKTGIVPAPVARAAPTTAVGKPNRPVPVVGWTLTSP